MLGSIKETVGVIVSRAFHKQRIEVKVFYDARSLSPLESFGDHKRGVCESKKLNLPTSDRWKKSRAREVKSWKRHRSQRD